MDDIERYNFWNLELKKEEPKEKKVKEEKKKETKSNKYTEVFHLDIQSHIH